MASFPNELMHTPKLWVTQKYRRLKTYTPMARGGHFAAMEEPQLLAEDVQNFVKIVEKRKKKWIILYHLHGTLTNASKQWWPWSKTQPLDRNKLGHNEQVYYIYF